MTREEMLGNEGCLSSASLLAEELEDVADGDALLEQVAELVLTCVDVMDVTQRFGVSLQKDADFYRESMQDIVNLDLKCMNGPDEVES